MLASRRPIKLAISCYYPPKGALMRQTAIILIPTSLRCARRGRSKKAESKRCNTCYKKAAHDGAEQNADEPAPPMQPPSFHQRVHCAPNDVYGACEKGDIRPDIHARISFPQRCCPIRTRYEHQDQKYDPSNLTK